MNISWLSNAIKSGIHFINVILCSLISNPFKNQNEPRFVTLLIITLHLVLSNDILHDLRIYSGYLEKSQIGRRGDGRSCRAIKACRRVVQLDYCGVRLR